MDVKCPSSEGLLHGDNGALMHSEKCVRDVTASQFKPISNGDRHDHRKELRAFTVSLPSALVKAGENENSKAEERGSQERRDFLLKTRDVSHLRRSLSDTAIHKEIPVYSPYHSPPYSNFARYLPCLSTPSDDSTSTDFDSLSLSQSEVTSESSVRFPISASQLSLPEPPDGGWGWVVVIAAFFVHVVTEGVIVSFGVFIEDLAKDFQESMSATSWVGSFSYGVPTLATPIASLIINQYGCRFTCIIGAVISSLGCLLGCFANSLLTLVFTFGILSGLGTSLSYTSALVIVSVYFDDRRATATGLSIAGTGVGALIFAPAVEALLNIYTWRGTFMFMAGALLNMAVCGALMRPVETRNERRQRQRLAWLELFAKESGLPHLTKSAEYVNSDVLGRIEILRDRLLAPRKRTVKTDKIQSLHNDGFSKFHTGKLQMPEEFVDMKLVDAPKLIFQVEPLPTIPENPLHVSDTLLKPTENQLLSTGDNSNQPGDVSDEDLVKSFGSRYSVREDKLLESGDVDHFNRDAVTMRRTRSLSCLNVTDLDQDSEHSNVPAIHDSTSNGFCKKTVPLKVNYRRKSEQVPSVHAQLRMNCRNWIENTNQSKLADHNHLNGQNATGPGLQSFGDEVTVHHSAYEHEEYLYRSMLIKAFGLNRASRCTALSLPDLTRVHRIRRRSSDRSTDSSSSDDSSASAYPICFCCGDLDGTDNVCGRILSKCFAPCQVILPELDAKYLFQRLCDIRLFHRSNFDLFVLSNFLLYFWYNVTYFFIGVHAQELGFSETSAALLFSILGGTNIIGEVVVGFLADRESVDTTALYLSMLLACGISTCLVPFMKSFVSLSLYSTIYGIGMAANDSLCTILLVEYVGLHHLTSALGICFFCQGVANIFGPPLIGYIIDSTGSHNVAFVISGVGLLIAGFSVLPIIIQSIRRKRRRQLRYQQRRQAQQQLEEQQRQQQDQTKIQSPESQSSRNGTVTNFPSNAHMNPTPVGDQLVAIC